MAEARTNVKPVKTLLHAIFVLAGITTVFIGPVLPILINKFSLNDLQAGYFFPAQFVGSLTGTFLTSYFGGRGKFLLAAIVGCFLMALGVLLMNSGNIAICLAVFSANGLGIGLTLPAINLLILEMAKGNTAAALSVLNFCWGAGAIVCKPFVDRAGDQGSIARPTLILAVLLGLFSLVIMVLP